MKKRKHKLITLGILFSIATVIIHIINSIITASSVLKDMLHVYSKIILTGVSDRYIIHAMGKVLPFY